MVWQIIYSEATCTVIYADATCTVRLVVYHDVGEYWHPMSILQDRKGDELRARVAGRYRAWSLCSFWRTTICLAR